MIFNVFWMRCCWSDGAYEAEGSFALSLARHNTLKPENIWEMKSQALKKNNLLTLHRGGESFDSLGGLAKL